MRGCYTPRAASPSLGEWAAFLALGVSVTAAYLGAIAGGIAALSLALGG